MARTILIHQKLGWPFLRVREGLFVLMAGSKRPLFNQAEKVLYILDGRCRVDLVGGFTAELEPGDIFVNPLLGEQTYRSLEGQGNERVYTYGFYLLPGALKRGVQRQPERSLKEALLTIMQQPAVFKGAIDHETRQLLKLIRSEMETLRTGHDASLYALNISLAVRLARQIQHGIDLEQPVLRPADIIITGVKEFVNKSQRSAITLGDIAWHVNLSPEHLSRVFRRELGISVMKYVQYCRVEEAKTLLLADSDQVRVLARRVGFGTVHSFIRNFKEQTGCSPTEYRQRYAGRKS